MSAPAPTKAPGAKRAYCRSREAVGRAERIVELRNQGWTFRDIGREVGVSPQAASTAFYRAARRAPPTVSWRLADELRASWALGYFRPKSGPERDARAKLAAAYGISAEELDAVLDAPREHSPPGWLEQANPPGTLIDRLRAASPEMHPAIFDSWAAQK